MLPFCFFTKLKQPDEVSGEKLDPIVLGCVSSPKLKEHSKGGYGSPWSSEASNTRKGLVLGAPVTPFALKVIVAPL